jgi:hypothetical protein
VVSEKSDVGGNFDISGDLEGSGISDDPRNSEVTGKVVVSENPEDDGKSDVCRKSDDRGNSDEVAVAEVGGTPKIADPSPVPGPLVVSVASLGNPGGFVGSGTSMGGGRLDVAFWNLYRRRRPLTALLAGVRGKLNVAVTSEVTPTGPAFAAVSAFGGMTAVTETPGQELPIGPFSLLLGTPWVLGLPWLSGRGIVGDSFAVESS